MFGLIGKKRHEHAVQALQRQHQAAVDSNLRLGLDLDRVTKEFKAQAGVLIATQVSTKEAWERAKVAGLEKDEAVARISAAEAECARVTACHVGRVRIFVMPVDALEMTARARAIEGSLRCQWSADERAVICDSGRPLSEAEYKAVVAAVMPQLNRT